MTSDHRSSRSKARPLGDLKPGVTLWLGQEMNATWDLTRSSGQFKFTVETMQSIKAHTVQAENVKVQQPTL